MGNSTSSSIVCRDISWGKVFMAAILEIWKDRNKCDYEKKTTILPFPINQIYSLAKEFNDSFLSSNVGKEKETKIIGWQFLDKGFVKINLDEATKENPGKVGFDGIIRDSTRNWITRYYGFIGNTTSLVAELWGLCPEDSPHKALIEDYKAYSEILQSCVFYHVYRKANARADFHANAGASSEEKLVLKELAIMGTYLLMLTDMSTVSDTSLAIVFFNFFFFL
ncbi:hypothetical protein F0562_007179 [Nyssa sinensis]|uniref:RNase H type-1 domain-containing protein n=1 Tax=Nyssa sinensis TaxID=561372 RepID=A0A5J5A591_9ASTE|nr:hypothetical protein F0562_007179 [Nyssa sinensis]